MRMSEFDDWRPPNRVLEVTIYKVWYPITESILHQVFDPFGIVEDLCVCKGLECTEARVVFQSKHQAAEAFGELHGRNIYDGCCQMEIKWGFSEETVVFVVTNKGETAASSPCTQFPSATATMPTLDDFNSEKRPVEAAASGEHTMSTTAASIGIIIPSKAGVALYADDGNTSTSSSSAQLPTLSALTIGEEVITDVHMATAALQASNIILGDVVDDAPVNCSMKCSCTNASIDNIDKLGFEKLPMKANALEKDPQVPVASRQVQASLSSSIIEEVVTETSVVAAEVLSIDVATSNATIDSPTKCSTRYLSSDIEVLNSVDTLTSICSAPPISLHFMADIPLDVKKECTLEHLQRSRDWIIVQQRQPWPPPIGLEPASSDADPQPLPWPLFHLAEGFNTGWCFSFPRKPPWPPPVRQNFSSLTSLLIIMMCDGHEPTLQPIPWLFFNCYHFGVPCGCAKSEHSKGKQLWPPSIRFATLCQSLYTWTGNLLGDMSERNPLMQKFNQVECTVIYSWNSGVFRNQFQAYGCYVVMPAAGTNRRCEEHKRCNPEIINPNWLFAREMKQQKCCDVIPDLLVHFWDLSMALQEVSGHHYGCEVNAVLPSQLHSHFSLAFGDIVVELNTWTFHSPTDKKNWMEVLENAVQTNVASLIPALYNQTCTGFRYEAHAEVVFGYQAWLFLLLLIVKNLQLPWDSCGTVILMKILLHRLGGKSDVKKGGMLGADYWAVWTMGRDTPRSWICLEYKGGTATSEGHRRNIQKRYLLLSSRELMSFFLL